VGQNPSRIDRQIVANRDEIAATLDAITYQINVPARFAERSPEILSDTVGLVDSIAEKLSAATGAATAGVPRSITSRSRRVIPLAVAYFIGMLIGLSWPKRAVT
jgi:hypothetical protein